jgi:hypothetical protein
MTVSWSGIGGENELTPGRPDEVDLTPALE